MLFYLIPKLIKEPEFLLFSILFFNFKYSTLYVIIYHYKIWIYYGYYMKLNEENFFEENKVLKNI